MLACGHPDECLGYIAGSNPGDPTACLWCLSLRETREAEEAKAVRVVRLFTEIAHETPGLDYLSGSHVYVRNHPHGCPVCEALDAVYERGVGEPTTLTPEQRGTLHEFWKTGLLWLVNTSVLHPRGYAIAVQLSDLGEPVGMMVLGDGREPWAFADTDAHESFLAHMENELRREEEWQEREAS